MAGPSYSRSSAELIPSRNQPPPPRGILRQNPRLFPTFPPEPHPTHSPKRHSLPSIPSTPQAHRDRFASLPVNVYEGDRAALAAGQTPTPIAPAQAGFHIPAQQRPTRLPDPQPKVLLRQLECVLRKMNARMIDHLDREEVIAMHERDAEQRRQWERDHGGKPPDGFHVFGVSLKEVVLYASSRTIVGGHQHNLPTVVFACIEELYRTGIYQHDLFRALPSRERHLHLIEQFDTPRPGMDASTSLRGQTMPDVCALLSTYLSSLPEKLLDVSTYTAIWTWCIKPSIRREDERRAYEEWLEEEARDKHYPPPSSRVKGKHRPAVGPEMEEPKGDLYKLESEQILTAQILFRLLPRSHFSLLVYLCGFFTQIPLCPENGLGFEDIARLFGERLLGGTKSNSRRMMMWILTRWWRLGEGLVSAEEGLSRRGTLLRNNEPGSPTSPKAASGGRESSSSESSPRSRSPVTPVDHIHPVIESRTESEHLFGVNRTHSTDTSSVYSTTSINPPMVMLDRVLHQLRLERELQHNGVEGSDERFDMLLAEDKARVLAAQLKGQGKQDGQTKEAVMESLKRQLEGALSERDEALRILEEIRRLVQ